MFKECQFEVRQNVILSWMPQLLFQPQVQLHFCTCCFFFLCLINLCTCCMTQLGDLLYAFPNFSPFLSLFPPLAFHLEYSHSKDDIPCNVVVFLLVCVLHQIVWCLRWDLYFLLTVVFSVCRTIPGLAETVQYLNEQMTE